MLGNHRAYETVLRLARETHALIWDAALAIVRAVPPMPLGEAGEERRTQ